MSARHIFSNLTPAEKTILSFLRDHAQEFVLQEQIADHVTQTAGLPFFEAMEKLNTKQLVHRHPKVTRQWGLTVDGEKAAELIPAAPGGRPRGKRGKDTDET